MLEDGYHHGRTIKKYREKCGMTQQELAEQWPRSGGNVGVDWHYVQLVEYGKKKITNVYTLRKLSDLLNIPLWEFGLSEYDPFAPQNLPGDGKFLLSETLDVAEALIQQTLALRRTAPLPQVEQSTQRIRKLFVYFRKHLPPPAQLETRFLEVLLQEQNLVGLMYFENQRYAEALATFSQMYHSAKGVGHALLTAHALQKMGVELKRAGRMQDAIEALEEARDLSFGLSKHMGAFTNAYMAHVQAAAGNELRFERAINTALTLAEAVQESYGDGTDFIFQRVSGILIIRSRGYLRLHQPGKVLDAHEEAKRQVSTDVNLWLDARLDLYRARAYLQLHEIEACIQAAREYFRTIQDWQSPHRTKRAYELLEEVDAAGYGKLPVVQDFRTDLLQAISRQSLQES